MVRSIIVAAALGAALLVCGCSGAQRAQPVSAESEEWRLRNLEEKSLRFQNQQMELTSRLNELEARVEDLEAAPRLGETDLRPQETEPQPLMSSDELPTPGPVTMPEDKPAKPSDWDKYPDATAEVMAAEPEAMKDESMMDKSGMAEAAKPAPKKMAPKKAAPRYAVKKKAKAPAGKSAYDKALALILAGKVEPGREGMQDFLKANPKSSLAPNAHYWLGETWYHQKRYAEAIVAFKKVHQDYPKDPKAAAALLKIGYSYAALGDKTNATFYLEVLTQDYPKSEPAALGRARLKKIK